MKKFLLLFGIFALGTTLWAAPALLGTWECEAITPEGDRVPFTITLREEASQIQASISSADGSPEIRDLRVEGDVVSLRVPYDGEIYDLRLTASGDKLEGQYSGAQASGKITGRRKQA